jgi:hypothetical protein
VAGSGNAVRLPERSLALRLAEVTSDPHKRLRHRDRTFCAFLRPDADLRLPRKLGAGALKSRTSSLSWATTSVGCSPASTIEV